MSAARYSIYALLDSAARNPVVTSDPQDLHPAEIVAYYAALSRLADMVETRKKVLGAFLAEEAKTKGHESDKGHLVVGFSTGDVVRERRVASQPDFDGLKDLVLEKGLAPEAAFDEVQILEINPSKLQHLIDTGKVSEGEVEALRKTTFAVKVRPTPAVAEVIAEATKPAVDALSEHAPKNGQAAKGKGQGAG